MQPSVFRSGAGSPSPVAKFESEGLRVYMKKLLQTTLGQEEWTKDREKVRGWVREISERVKDRMTLIQSAGYKYIVLVQVSEQRGQGGRMHMASHWEEGDVCISEVFDNERIIGTCTAVAVRITREAQDR